MAGGKDKVMPQTYRGTEKPDRVFAELVIRPNYELNVEPYIYN
ncbi:hypothetical protein [Salipaludibacillus aurantiacus]|nr:hypothetical protein [Salipaludibacillus aurantiacus]